MTVEPWHVSIFVTAGVVLAELAVHAVLRSIGDAKLPRRVRTVGLVLLVGLTVVVTVAALGTSLSDRLASVASLPAAAAAAWLAWLSYREAHGDQSGTGATPGQQATELDITPEPPGRSP